MKTCEANGVCSTSSVGRIRPLRNGRTRNTSAIRRKRWCQIDSFGIYCPGTDAVYVVPVDELPVRQGALRVAPTLNKQVRKVRWAADFEVKRPG